MKKKIFISLIILWSLTSCHEEYLNPSATTEVQSVSSVEGLISLSNGLQSKYTIGRQSPLYNAIVGSSLSTKQLRVTSSGIGNTDEVQIEAGGNSISTANAVVRNLWEQNNLVKSNSDLVLNNLEVSSDLGVRSGLLGSATIFKALALANLATFWEQAPIEVTGNASFSTRTEVLETALSLLESAQTTVTATPVSTSFYNKAISGVSIPNTLNALIARYALMLGQYDKAISAAAKVDLTVKSEFRFDGTNRNPIFDVAFSTENVVQPRDLNMGLPDDLKPSTSDTRIDFYFKSRTPSTAGNYLGSGFFTANDSSVPVYLPGEMLLIQAEAYARNDDLSNALTFLNRVVTKKPADDVWNLGADLPALGTLTKENLLIEIYRNRCIELFMSGLSLEDSRRFQRTAPTVDNPAGGERTRNFYPYPDNERDNNTNTPANSSI